MSILGKMTTLPPANAYDASKSLFSLPIERFNEDETIRARVLAIFKRYQSITFSYPETPDISNTNESRNPIKLKKFEKIFIRPETIQENLCFFKFFVAQMQNLKKINRPVYFPKSSGYELFYKRPILLLKEDFVTKKFRELYDPLLYLKGLKKIPLFFPLIEIAINYFHILNKNWGFKIYDRYEIILSTFGPKSCHNYKTGSILILNSPKDSSDDIYIHEMIIREMIYMGIHENICEKYKLTFLETERLVDLMSLAHLKILLVNFQEQDIKNKSIDNFIDRNKIINDLPDAIKRYVEKYPRK